MEQRLDKVLASQGVGSRSQVKAEIKQRNVQVNGQVITRPETKINTEADEVIYKGRQLMIKEHVYLMLNKPAGVVSATVDRCDKTVLDLVPKPLRRKGLFPVGRLDKDTEGLLILTDDGAFAHNVLSPKKKVYKLYNATIDGEISERDIQAFAQGIVFSDGTKCLPACLNVIKTGEQTIAQVRICEGKYHQVKKMFLTRGHKVIYLQRIQFGNLSLDGKLNKGECRELNKLEIKNMLFGEVY